MLRGVDQKVRKNKLVNWLLDLHICCPVVLVYTWWKAFKTIYDIPSILGILTNARLIWDENITALYKWARAVPLPQNVLLRHHTLFKEFMLWFYHILSTVQSFVHTQLRKTEKQKFNIKQKCFTNVSNTIKASWLEHMESKSSNFLMLECLKQRK